MASFRGIGTGLFFLFLCVDLAAADTRSVDYTTIGNWNISAVYDVPTNSFSFCSAGTTYRDSTYFMITENVRGQWALSLFNNSWPANRSGTVVVELRVDGYLLDRTQAQWVTNGVVIPFNSVQKVLPLMRGHNLQLATNQGSSLFTLDGSFKAALATAECWRLHSGAGNQASNGAFGPQGTQAGGAFASQGSSQGDTNSVQTYSRADTLEFAAAYLGKLGVPFQILPEEKNLMTHFPVNWTYGSKSIGGMMVMQKPNLDEGAGERVLIGMLQDQAGSCDGKSGITREPTHTEGNVTYYGAKGACEVNNEAYLANYAVTQVGNFVLVTVELIDPSDANSLPSLQQQQELSGTVTSSFTPR